MRERFDAGTGLVALGAVLLLVSLFVDWYQPSGDAWAVFESVDILLALAAVACLVAIVPRYNAMQRAVPVIAFVALFVVVVQLLDPPPAARNDTLEAGAWLALAATALMAAGATLTAASISVTIDVRSRDRRRRSAAIDARRREEAAEAEAEAAAAAEAEADASEPVADDERLWRAPRRPYVEEPPPVDDAPARRGGAAADGDETDQADDADDERGPAPHAADAPAGPGPGEDPDRTQALDPVDAPRENSP